MKKIDKAIRYVWVIFFVFSTLAMAAGPTASTDVASTSNALTVTAIEGDVTVDFFDEPIINIFDLLTAINYIGQPDDGTPIFDACDMDDDGDVDIFDLLAMIDIMD
jgi:hypothetical protein